MDLSVSLSFYLVIGIAVSLAVWLADEEMSTVARAFRLASSVFFWPIYLPIVLQQSRLQAEANGLGGPQDIGRSNDELDNAISLVEQELDTALSSLDDWSGHVMAHQHGRFSELKAAWNLQANRIRELDALLDQSGFVDAKTISTTPFNGQPRGSRVESDYYQQSERTRQQNVDRLRVIRTQMYGDLMGTLAWVRELVTMIHLARYTGAPAKRAEELVAQIAAAVEGLSEVNQWQDEPIESCPTRARDAQSRDFEHGSESEITPFSETVSVVDSTLDREKRSTQPKQVQTG